MNVYELWGEKKFRKDSLTLHLKQLQVEREKIVIFSSRMFYLIQIKIKLFDDDKDCCYVVVISAIIFSGRSPRALAPEALGTRPPCTGTGTSLNRISSVLAPALPSRRVFWRFFSCGRIFRRFYLPGEVYRAFFLAGAFSRAFYLPGAFSRAFFPMNPCKT